MSDSYSYQGPPMNAAMSGAGNTDPYKIYRDGIAAIESRGSGDYNAVGPVTKSGDRAYGRYQVMGNNIPEWTQNALGKSMSAKEFQSDPKAQDAVFNHQFGNYLTKYGNGNDAISAWFSGQPLAQSLNKSDGYMKTARYVDNVNRAMAGLKTMPAGTPYNDANAVAQNNDPDAPSQNAAPVSQQGQPSNGYAVPNQGQDESNMSAVDRFKQGGLGGLFGLKDNSARGFGWGDALTSAGIAAMARDNPAGANAMAQVPSMEARAWQPKMSVQGYQPQTGNYLSVNNRTGQVTPGNTGVQSLILPEGENKDFASRNNDINGQDADLTKLREIQDQLVSGKLDPSVLSRLHGNIAALNGTGNENDQNIYNSVHWLQLNLGRLMKEQKGTLSDKDLGALEESLMPSNSEYDAGAMTKGLNNLIYSQRTNLRSNLQAQQNDIKRYQGQVADPSYSDRYGAMSTKWGAADEARDAVAEKFAAAHAKASQAPATPTTVPPKFGGGSSSGGSLKTVDPNDHETLKGLKSGDRFRGTDGKIYEVH